MTKKRIINTFISLVDKMISALDTSEEIFFSDHPLLSKGRNICEFSEKEKKENNMRIEVLTAEILESIEKF